LIDCIFCKIVAGQLGTKLVYSDPDVVAFRDNNPQAPTHILVIPKQHVERVSALTESDLPLVGKIHRAIQSIAKQEKLDQGFRVITNDGKDAGQTVNHLHYHVLGGRHMKWPPG
jgi:histidine triad (HIT) family protein